ncbi:YhgE/Pip family protein [Cellulomonas sp. ES6]|uniref:YhgE/Pip family protein n=1 Tax=Cellulomonas sp. ES6 TaxID=3039384 RepID=UPI0024B64B2C|nr:YhgE/Pip family protein [Cellulomonas sp. ES6]WHP18940.1 YhgE/Pip family protein [Cellulomonas sp. ES6]
MTIPLAWSELRRYRMPVQRVALLFLVLLPSLYGGLYLWSNWDPYGHLGDIEVAVVDEDEPVEVAGQRVDAGAQVVRELQADPVVAWTPTDARDARAGLADGTYPMSITIPRDFSANLAAVQSGEPEVAEVVLRRDGANGFIVGVAAQGLALELKERINAAATSAYFTVAFRQLAELRSGLQDAADGATELRDGLTTAHDGAATLASGLAGAVQASGELRDGAGQVAEGDERIAAVVDPLVDRVVPALPAVAQAADQVAGGAAGLAGLVAQDAEGLPTRTAQLVALLDGWAQTHPDQAADPGFQQIQAAARAADARAGEVVAAAQAVNGAAADVAARADAVTAEVPAIQQRIRAAQSDIDRLATGSRQVADGLGELTTGLQTAADGAGRLADGTQQLQQGAATLTDGLTSAVQRVPTLGASDPEGTADQLADPTQVRVESRNEAQYYGQGLAPFFFGIALCVFGVAVFTVLRPVNPRGLASAAGPCGSRSPGSSPSR